MKNPVRLNAGRGEVGLFLRKVIRYIVARIVLPPGSLSISLVDDTTIREINHRYRKIDRATDVLTFCLNEELIWGDVYISVETVRRNAKRQEVLFEAELAWVVSHAFAHAL
ncbi:MAG: rRNA maturation RNase YbeY, partial [Candidatus Margulisiibacteriota bacterium]